MVLQSRKLIAAGSTLPITLVLSVSKNTTVSQALKMSVIVAEGCVSKSVIFYAKTMDV